MDSYNGTSIADPYPTLESADNPATQRWIEEENELTAAYLARTPGREAIKRQLTQLWDYEKFAGFVGLNWHVSERCGFVGIVSLDANQ